MTTTSATKLLLKNTAMLAALSLAAISVNAETIDETFNVSEGGSLDLRTDQGSIHIETHNSNTIEMEVDIDGRDSDEFEVRYELKGDSLIVRGERESRGGWGKHLKVKFYFTVPENYNLDLQTSGGSIGIEDLEGNVDANTSGGSITVGNIKGNVDLHTSGGSITTEDIHGEIDAHTSGGSVTVRFAQQISENASLSTSGGSVTAYLNPDIKVDLDASTSGGSVRSEFDVDGRVKKRSIRGEINGGGPSLKLRTSGGSVRIKEL